MASVLLTWNASSGTTSYRIYRSTTQGVRGTLIQNVVPTTATDTTAAAGTTYWYGVTALNGAGESGLSTQAMITTAPTPSAQQITSFTASDNSITAGETITLTWTTTNATSVTLDGLNVALNGSTTRSPSVDHTYTLVANGSAAPVSATQSITVTQVTPGTGIVDLTLTSALTGTLPWTFGQVFAEGDVPSGSPIYSDETAAQGVIKATYPDGSARFAILSGIGAFTASSPKAVSVVIGSPAGSPVALSTLQGLAPAVTVSCGSFGTVTLAPLLATPFRQFISGPVMSEWHFRSGVGADSHLVVWFQVRLYSNNAIELEIIVENGYCQIPTPTLKTYDCVVTVNGSVRFSRMGLNQYHHTRWSLNAWYGTDPQITPSHDVSYMRETLMFPNYGLTNPSAGALNSLIQTYTPMSNVQLTPSFPDTGAQDQIGLLPKWDALYLTSGDSRAYNAVVANARGGGSYSVHFRDEITNKPVVLAQRPSFWTQQGGWYDEAPAPSGGNVYGADIAHQPSIGYTAYALTGKYLFLEEAQLWAMCWTLYASPITSERDFSNGYIRHLQTRGIAWQWRTIATALILTESSDPIRADMLNQLGNNWADRVTNYVSSGGQFHTNLGMLDLDANANPGSGYYTVAPWMQHFMIQTVGFIWDMNLEFTIPQLANLQSCRDYCYSHVVNILGPDTTGNCSYRRGATTYHGAYAPEPPGGVYPTMYANWGLVYTNTATFKGWVIPNAPGTYLFNTDSEAAVPFITGTDYTANLMPAIASAVDHGATGAQDSYDRLSGSSSWVLTLLNDTPQFGILPRATGIPAWMQGKQVNEWFSISGTVAAGSAADPTGNPADPFSSSNRRLSFSGMALKDEELVLPANGGHNDYSGNEVTSLDLSVDVPAWALRHAKSASVQIDVPYYLDGLPSSRHTYWAHHWSETNNRVMLHYSRFVYGNAVSFSNSNGFDLDTNAWDAAGTWADGFNAGCQDASGNVWAFTDFATKLRKWTAATDTWAINGSFGAAGGYPICHDSFRNQLFQLSWGDGEGFGVPATNAHKYTSDGSVSTAITFNASAAYTAWQAEMPSYAAMEYDSETDRFLFYSATSGNTQRIYVITPNSGTTWDMSILAVTGVTPPAIIGGGVYNRFRYVAALKGFVLMASGNEDVLFIRTA